MTRTDQSFSPLFTSLVAFASPIHEAMTRRPLYRQASAPDLAAATGRLVGALLTELERWRARHRQRHALLRLDDHLLADIGLTRAEAEAEARKPFWRA